MPFKRAPSCATAPDTRINLAPAFPPVNGACLSSHLGPGKPIGTALGRQWVTVRAAPETTWRSGELARIPTRGGLRPPSAFSDTTAEHGHLAKPAGELARRPCPNLARPICQAPPSHLSPSPLVGSPALAYYKWSDHFAAPSESPHACASAP